MEEPVELRLDRNPVADSRKGQDASGAGQWPWAVLILVSVAQFMVIIDATVVNIALPSIGKAFRFASAADLQWVATAYVLVTGGLTLLGGRLTDLFERRRLLLIGLLLFAAASLTTGLAPSALLLVISRAAQGLGAAVLTPAALSIITTTYTGAQRTTALAVWGALGAAGAAAGVVLGGVLTSWFGWQWVFFINVPIGAVAAGVALFVLPASVPRRVQFRDLDIAGAVVLIAGLVALVFGLTSGANHDWASAQTLTSLIASAALLATFGLIERRVKQPIAPPSIWRIRSLVSGNAVFLATSAVMGGVFFLSSLYLQRVLGLTAWQAGLAFLPLTLAVAGGSGLASRLVPHAGVRAVIVTGLIIEGGGALLLARVPSDAGFLVNVLPGFLAIGVGLGFSFVASPLVVMADVRGDEAGLASGLMQTAHEIGISLGIASLSAVATATALQMGLAAGYRQSMVAAALVAGLLAIVSLIVVPAVRVSGGGGIGIHGGVALTHRSGAEERGIA
jgi:EmrB/QacA subfamily drug resistance transporter